MHWYFIASWLCHHHHIPTWLRVWMPPTYRSPGGIYTD